MTKYKLIFLFSSSFVVYSGGDKIFRLHRHLLMFDKETLSFEVHSVLIMKVPPSASRPFEFSSMYSVRIRAHRHASVVSSSQTSKRRT